MLAAIGVESIDDLFAHVPASLRARAAIDLPPGLTEPELRRHLAGFAARNAGALGPAVFLGAGAYPHWIPAVVDQVLLRSEFATAYTPYQPEVSQGTLQAIFEFQTFAALLLGLDVANASMYDGASATAEAVLMARRVLPGRRTVWLARALHPHYRATVKTYLRGLGDVQIRELPFGPDGRTDVTGLDSAVGPDALCVVLGQPNVFGVLEDLAGVAAAMRAVGALTITATTEPLALALVRSPGACGADIAVAEGQSFGLPLAYGGPGVGLFATHERHVRNMPGRIVGETADARGRRGYVLTLATREQHIRRERATSNICTNQGLMALANAIHMALLGAQGMRDVAVQSMEKAHYLARRAAQVPGVSLWSGDAPFVREFVLRLPGPAAAFVKSAEKRRLLAGVPLARFDAARQNDLLVAVTEKRTKEEMDRYVEALSEWARRPASKKVEEAAWN